MQREPVARVVGGRVPAEDDDWAAVEAVIRLDDRFGEDCLLGLTEFSHIEVVFHFDQAQERAGARHPRGNRDWPLTGIFAQRGKDHRPNRLGVSRCLLVSVVGRDIRVRGLDAIDGTPVLDLKPWMAEFAPQEATHQPAWATELMQGYWSSTS